MSGDTTQRAWAASEDLVLFRQYHAGVAIKRIDVPTRTTHAVISRVQQLIKEGLLVARGPSQRGPDARDPSRRADPLTLLRREREAEAAPRRKQRACLRCAREFTSEHAGHRLCGYCRSNAASESPFEAGYALRVSVRVRA